MATSYTQHYGLCQWAAEDSFMRTEFNQDNAKIDAAIKAALAEAGRVEDKTELALDGLADLSYNVYNLALQNYYDGKQTGFKKAMVFDGFRDGSMIASLSGGIQRGNGVLTLQNRGQGNITIGYGSERNYTATTATKTITGSGTITGFECQLYSGMYVSSTGYVNYTLTRSGVTVAEGTSTTPEFSPQSTQTVTATFPGGVTVSAGATISLKLQSPGSAWLLTLATDNRTLAGTFLISAVTGTAGRMTSREADLPACGGLRGWVRHKNGAAGLSVRDKTGAVHGLTADGTRSTTNLQGASCSETAFRLEKALPVGKKTVLLDLNLDGGSSMEVFDYGVVLF